MINTQVIIEQTLNATAEQVWQAISDKDKMRQWYFNLDDFKPEVGFQFSFKGQGSKGENYVHLCKVTEVIPHKKLQYSWQYENIEGKSLVSFELYQQGNQTLLRLKHDGLNTFPQNSDDFKAESFNMGWTELITNLLVGFLEKGK